MTWLLDTAILADAARGTDAGLVRWLEAQPDHDLHLSVLSLGELRKGFIRMGDVGRRARLEAWLVHDLPRQFGARLLPVDGAVALAWGELTARGLAAGRTLPVMDGLLLATAQVHRLTLVSRNVTDAIEHGVPVFSPYSDSA